MYRAAPFGTFEGIFRFSVLSIILANLLENTCLLVIGAFRSTLFFSMTVSRFAACDRPVSGNDQLVSFKAFYDLSYSCLLQEDSNVCLLPSTKIPLIIAISFEGYWNTLPQRHICNHQNTLSKVIQTQKIGVYTTWFDNARPK